jgi:hypothetical protein
MILKRALLQSPIPTGPVCPLAHINIDDAALLEIHIIKIEHRCESEEPIRGFKGSIAMIEFKTQEEILLEEELLVAAEETKTICVGGAHPTGGWERMPINERVAYTSEDKKGVLGSRDWIITFQDILIVWIHKVALVANTPAVWDRLKEQTVFDFGRRGRNPL